MRSSCSHAEFMPRALQIRNLPDDLHRKLKVRAASLGVTLSDYARRELEQAVARPTLEEVLDRLAALPPVDPDPTPAEVIRAERDGR